MSYQEKSVTVSLTAYLMIVGYYLFNVFQMFQGGGLVASQLFSLWAVVIVAGIIVVISGNILANIILSIVHAIRTGGEESERFIEDERDKLIDLKGNKVAYITFSVGVLLAMLTFVFGQPPLVMFSIIIFFSIAAEIAGNLAQIILYRRGM
ncbi:MAG: hypothetical protein L6461_01515 [Anaerolineae bacterium]|jgi:hypothetical protein|nr:hypothetical protein [Anaerolineae bacterium]